MRRASGVVVVVLIASALGRVEAQRGNPQPPQSPRAAAPIDLTGYWVSIVTQNWRWRMVTPPRGDYSGVQMTPAARKIADAWDPAKDEAAGEQCKSYGAPAIMSVPGRIRISWQDDRTLKVETDAGMQTRLFRFASAQQPPGAGARTWQGDSVAEWQVSRTNIPLFLRPASPIGGGDPPEIERGGSLRVVTTNVRPGYLRKNGVPYSADVAMTEHWEVFERPNGEEWLTITTEIVDPLYLSQPRLLAIPFKKEADGSKWDPTPCSARW